MILHAKIWYVNMYKKLSLINGGYYVEVYGSDGKKGLWEVADYRIVEDIKEHYEIGLQGFNIILFDKDRGVRGGCGKISIE